MADKKVPQSIDDYIENFGFTPEVQERMQRLRQIIREEAPAAAEKISWAMPTFTLNGNLVHFAAAKNHIGLYPGENGVAHFVARLDAEGFKHSKGAIQMPNSQPLPEALVRDIVRFRVGEQG